MGRIWLMTRYCSVNIIGFQEQLLVVFESRRGQRSSASSGLVTAEKRNNF